ncbi:hypothetical protein [Ferruginibacter profundus]
MEPSTEKRIITILYITAGIFLLVGIYMYKFGIVATREAIPGGGTRDTLPYSFNGKGLIIVGFIFALYAALLNYQRKKK